MPMRDVADLRRAEGRERLARQVLERLNDPAYPEDSIRDILQLVKGAGGFEAVGLRLHEGDDYPYHEAIGLPERFIRRERSLCARDRAGKLVRDRQGEPVLECMCGNVLRGRVDPSLPFFTPGGSFWTNCTTELLTSTTASELRAPTRNRCNTMGYESVALIPLRVGSEIIGLLQINDQRCDRFTPALVRYLEGVGASIGIALRRVQAEKKLQESQRKLDLALRSAQMGAWQWDIAVDRRHFDPHAYSLLGLDPEVFTGSTDEFFAVVHPDDRDRLKEAVASAIDRGLPYEAEYRVVSADGTVRHLCTRAGLTRDQEGRPLRMDGVLWDVSDRKRSEDEHAGLTAQLQQAQKMESMARLAGGVAHDFNNMLCIIGSSAESALQQVDPSHPSHTDLQEILSASRHSADLTRQLLAFARKQTVTPRVLGLNEAVEGMLKMLRRLIGEDLELAWQPGVVQWPVCVDPAQIDQIMANLCVNARDAIADVGKITIETGTRVVLEPLDGADETGLVQAGYVWLAVTDTGCGMDRETLSHVFEPFFTTKRQGEGTGLGLATVYGIVNQNNGFIDLRSEPGQGTTITIYLPRHVPANAAEQSDAVVSAPPHGQETVLLVEDEPAILRAIKKMLEKQGYTVLPATTPGEAMRLAKEHVGEIHLLVTDVVMPEMNGRDLARHVVSLNPRTKHLFMSGYTADIIAHHGVFDEGAPFIEKPFSAAELAIKVSEALKGESAA